MQLSHYNETEFKQNDTINPVIKFLDNISEVTKTYGSFEKAERAIKILVNELESSLLKETLSQYDINVKMLKKGDKIYHQVLREEKTYKTSAGEISIYRSLFRASGEKKSICPLELQAGIINGSWTPTAARLGLYVTAQLTPYQGAKLFKEFGSFKPSKTSLDTLARKLGSCWDDHLDDFNNKLYEEIVIPETAITMSASLDGIMIPLNKKASNGYEIEETTEITQDATEKKKPFYKEASCASISFYDNEGERLSTVRFGRMPEEGKKTLKKTLSQAIQQACGERPELKIVKIADGAKDNWNYLSKELQPGKGIEILDYYHASDHLNDAFEAAYGKGNADAIAQYKKYRSLLKNEENGVEKVINTLRYLHKKHPQSEKILTELNYFRNNKHRMIYAEAKQLKLPIGSGVIEASCKTLITQRMKCAGMRWDIKGGQGILTARGLIQSNLFDKGWKLISQCFVDKFEMLADNIIPIRCVGI